MQIRRISLSKLSKAEMLTIMVNIVDILKEYDVEKLHLDFMLKILEKNQQQVDTIKRLPGPQRLTPEVQKWHKLRIEYAGAIFIQMRGIAKANLKSISKEVQIAKEVTQLYLLGIRKHNKANAEALIGDFLNAVKKVEHVSDAFTKIGLMPYIDELEMANTTHNKLYNKRGIEKTKIQKGTENKAIMTEAQAALRTLFEQIEVGNRTYPELNYEPLMLEINTMLARFTNIIKTRDTYNKKRAKKAKEEKENVLKNSSPQCTEGFQLSDSEDLEAGSF